MVYHYFTSLCPLLSSVWSISSLKECNELSSSSELCSECDEVVWSIFYKKKKNFEGQLNSIFSWAFQLHLMTFLMEFAQLLEREVFMNEEMLHS